MDWPDVDHGVFGISVAARLSGLHPQTLRVYDREGVIEPDRSEGGTRLYSGRDIERLREIAGLVQDGINIAGIKRILRLQQQIRHLEAKVERLQQEDAPGTYSRASACEEQFLRPPPGMPTR